MVRFRQSSGIGDSNIVFSNDGRRFATTIWRGDLERNVNEYTLLLFDATNLARNPADLMKVDFTYDSSDQNASPIAQIAVLNAKSVVALATFHGEPRQVVEISTASKEVTPLTDQAEGVVSFGVTPDGSRLIFATLSLDSEDVLHDTTRISNLTRDGFSLQDRDALSDIPMFRLAAGDFSDPHNRLRYFLVESGGRPRQINENPGEPVNGEIPHFWVAPDGLHTVIYPFVPSGGRRPELGLVDMVSGKIEQLLAENDTTEGPVANVIWSHDSKSVVFTVIAHDAGESLGRIGQVNLATRKIVWADIGAMHEVLGWNSTDDSLLLTQALRQVSMLDGQVGKLAKLHRSAEAWGHVRTIKSNYDLSPDQIYSRATNGQLIVGVKNTLSAPPELAVYDLKTKRTRILTNLNPILRERSLGEVSRIRWSTPYDAKTSVGYLIKPVGFVAGRRYPLIIQWIDLYYSPDFAPFILDSQLGVGQYNGAAAQVWANAGFVVLLTPLPFAGPAPVQMTPDEGPHVVAHIDRVLDLLDSQGLIDRSKVAIAGWSWAGWLTEYILTHSSVRFAAAATTDNLEFNLVQFALRAGSPAQSEMIVRGWQNTVPWGASSERWRALAIDFRYDEVKSPWLIETHGLSKVGLYAETYAALKLLNTPVDFFVYPDAPHAVRSPLHRLHSLSTHSDWFRFWLQGYEDPDDAKQTQYLRWRAMRELWGRS